MLLPHHGPHFFTKLLKSLYLFCTVTTEMCLFLRLQLGLRYVYNLLKCELDTKLCHCNMAINSKQPLSSSLTLLQLVFHKPIIYTTFLIYQGKYIFPPHISLSVLPSPLRPNTLSIYFILSSWHAPPFTLPTHTLTEIYPSSF